MNADDRGLGQTDAAVMRSGDDAQFGADVRRAFNVCRSTPALPLLTTVFAAIAALASSAVAGLAVAGLVGVVFLGWVGSERLWFLRAYNGQSLTVGAALRAALS